MKHGTTLHGRRHVRRRVRRRSSPARPIRPPASCGSCQRVPRRLGLHRHDRGAGAGARRHLHEHLDALRRAREPVHEQLPRRPERHEHHVAGPLRARLQRSPLDHLEPDHRSVHPERARSRARAAGPVRLRAPGGVRDVRRPGGPAEGEGFEPSVGCPTVVFKTTPFGRSGTPPSPTLPAGSGCDGPPMSFAAPPGQTERRRPQRPRGAPMTFVDLQPAAQRMTHVIENVRDDRARSASTPCTDTSVGDLVDHVGFLTKVFTGAANKDAEVGSQAPSADASNLGDDWRTRHPARPRVARRRLARPGGVVRHDQGRRARHAGRDRRRRRPRRAGAARLGPRRPPSGGTTSATPRRCRPSTNSSHRSPRPEWRGTRRDCSDRSSRSPATRRCSTGSSASPAATPAGPPDLREQPAKDFDGVRTSAPSSVTTMRVLELRGAQAVARDRGPAVGPEPLAVGAHRDHRLDRERHARLEDASDIAGSS